MEKTCNDSNLQMLSHAAIDSSRFRNFSPLKFPISSDSMDAQKWKELPEEMGNLSALRILTLVDCQSLKSQSHSVFRLDSPAEFYWNGYSALQAHVEPEQRLQSENAAKQPFKLQQASKSKLLKALKFPTSTGNSSSSKHPIMLHNLNNTNLQMLSGSLLSHCPSLLQKKLQSTQVPYLIM